MDAADPLSRLHATLRRRDTPETVAELVRVALPASRPGPLRTLLARIRGGSKQAHFGWSSMPAVFREPVRPVAAANRARELARLFLDEALPEGDDPDAIEATLAGLHHLIGKTPGRSSFRDDRLGRPARKTMGLGLSRRRYDKLFRLAARLERKAARLRDEEAKFDLLMISKSALAPSLTLEDLGGDLPTAAFVAYYAARMKLRSEFTVSGQQRPFDELSEQLLDLCDRSPTASWWAIAHVFPRADILARLTDEQRGRLLGTWFDILQLLADRLDAVQARSGMNLDTMIVKRGDDSSTWNTLAGAWNRARDHWIALVDALGMDGLFDTMLPGKVMRLMAADVAAWHRAVGQGLHPDTLVWKKLPRPWLVLRGEASCTLADIEEACAEAGVNPVKSGWGAPRARTEVAAFRPTPELVHGVSVSNPYLADYLRRRGVYSGKVLKAGPKVD